MSTNASSNVIAGLDWAVHTHAVCVIDASGTVLERFEIAHDREGLSELMRRLARVGGHTAPTIVASATPAPTHEKGTARTRAGNARSEQERKS